ncbi:MAG TPA: DUF899 family protein [Bacillales bacterium]|nr:DUF899 family protein [Bacillales bacterium]
MTELESRIESLEKEIAEKKKELARLRKQRERREVEDFRLRDPDGNEIKLSQLFGEHDELVVIQNMGRNCSYCTMWADGFNGIYEYVQRKAGFALASPDSPDIQQTMRKQRGWTFPMVSTEGTSFKKETGFADEHGQHPGVSVFRKGPHGELYYTNRADFGPGDDFCAVWHVYDMLSDRGDGK